MKNIMDTYINYTEKTIKKYIRLILDKKYNDEVTKEILKTYINARYYNIVHTEKKARAFYQRILEELDYKAEILRKRSDIENKESIDYVIYIFNYILFFDNVRNVENIKNYKDLKEVVKDLSKVRQNKFNIKTPEDFAEKLYKEIMDNMLDKEIFLEKLECDDFMLQFEKNKQHPDLYFVTLDHNIRMPSQYSEEAVYKVFTTGIIAEDKLKVEYLLLSVVALKDILNGEFKDTYIAEFTSTLLKKAGKIDSVLSQISNQALQEKINLNIMYEEYSAHKKSIQKYINSGYNFTITIDSSMKDVNELDKLKMFKYIIVPKNLELYNQIKKNVSGLDNVIEKEV